VKSFFQCSVTDRNKRVVLGSTHPTIQYTPEALSPSLKRLEPEAEYSTPKRLLFIQAKYFACTQSLFPL
jgi:hypothetical protein